MILYRETCKLHIDAEASESIERRGTGFALLTYLAMSVETTVVLVR